MITAIIRAKIDKDAKDEYMCAYDPEDVCGIIDTLYTGGWYEAEVCKVTNIDKKLEAEIYDCYIGSEEERRLLRKYYRKQGK
jgi:hypothetical protein